MFISYSIKFGKLFTFSLISGPFRKDHSFNEEKLSLERESFHPHFVQFIN